MRDSFIFYRHYYEALKELPRDIQGEIYTAIMEYGLYGKETENLKPIASSIFKLIKPNLESDYRRFENGCKGGRPKKSTNQEKTEVKPKENLEETKIEPRGNEADTMVLLAENQPINNNINYNITNIQERKESISKDIPKKREKSAAKAAPNDIEKRRNSFYETLKPFLSKYPPEMLRKFYDYWSEMNKSGTKMRFELERTWEVSKRLSTWASRDNNFKSSMEIGTVLRDNTIDKYQNEEKWNR